MYILLIAPIVGIGVSVSLTKGFYIPTFISSVIADTPLYLIATTAAVLFFISLGLANLFILHGIFLDKLSVTDAGKQSRKIMSENWKDYFKQNVLFIAVMAAVLAIVAFVVLVLPLIVTDILPLSKEIKRVLLIFLTIQGTVVSVLADFLATPFYMLKMTQLYHEYKDNNNMVFKVRNNKTHFAEKAVIIIEIIAVVFISRYLNRNFETFFPLDSNVNIIAHRAGGIEAPENTVKGIITAYDIGVYGAEIDIQRTKDGFYIVNHDGNFNRVAGDKRKPSEMTLEEIKNLSVEGEPVPTFEDMLDASKGKLILFVELKGDTADRKMADDAVSIIKQRGMEDETVLICLKYDLIDYIEKTYPEIKSGYLTFASFGDTSLLNCDYLALEEEAATADTIAAIHKQGKKVLVWTVNKKGSQRHFRCSDADAVITDYISQADEIKNELHMRSDIRRLIDKIKMLFS